jgi:hypothetical protein
MRYPRFLSQQRMVDAGYAYMRAELDAGRLDALCAAAPLPSGLVL